MRERDYMDSERIRTACWEMEKEKWALWGRRDASKKYYDEQKRKVTEMKRRNKRKRPHG